MSSWDLGPAPILSNLERSPQCESGRMWGCPGTFPKFADSSSWQIVRGGTIDCTPCSSCAVSACSKACSDRKGYRWRRRVLVSWRLCIIRRPTRRPYAEAEETRAFVNNVLTGGLLCASEADTKPCAKRPGRASLLQAFSSCPWSYSEYILKACVYILSSSRNWRFFKGDIWRSRTISNFFLLVGLQ